MYELQAEIASSLYGLPLDFPPIPRILSAPFNGKTTLQKLMKDVSAMHGQVKYVH